MVHLHLHTVYSQLDGLCHIDKLIEKAKECGHNAIAITDHGNIDGVFKMHEECIKNNIKPIIGCELYFAWDLEEKTRPSHLTVLCQNKEGWEHLLNIIRFANTIGYYYKPRVIWEKLVENNGGLIVLSGCLGSTFNQKILAGETLEAEAQIKKFKDVFNERFFLELQNHGIQEQTVINNELIRIGTALDIELVATNDVHYLNEDDAEAQEVLVKAGFKKNKDDEEVLISDQFYYKTTEEMLSIFDKRYVETSQRIADSIDNNIIAKQKMIVPSYPKKELEKRIKNIVSNMKLNNTQKQRIKLELDIINEAQLSDYLLTVADYVDFANSHNYFVGPGRGSVAGSYVCFLLGIHSVDPLEYNLMFSRFYNKGRKGSLPDIDVDFSVKDIGNIRHHMEEQYGSEQVALIGTTTSMSGKAALKAVCRVFEVPFNTSNQYTKKMGDETDLNVAIHWDGESPKSEFRREYDKDQLLHRYVDIAIKLQGAISAGSIHAAGLVVSETPLHKMIPTRVDEKTHMVISNWDMHDVEKMGLLKFDFLSLSTLDIINDTIVLAKQPGLRSYHDIETNDQKAYDIICEGSTVGVFQMGKAGITALAQQIQPKNIEDLSAIIALYRPGPLGTHLDQSFVARRKDKDRIQYRHEKLKPILKDTLGVLIYQEQIIKILIALGGFDEHEADYARKVIGKKLGDEEMKKIGSKFIFQSVENGVPQRISNDIWEEMKFFCGYAFNKSHSISYAHLAYYTAYLKAHYPVEFLIACLNNSIGKKDPKENITHVAKYIREAKRLGITVLSPSITHSEDLFTKEDNAIRVGLSAIKGVGFGAEDNICRGSLQDFCVNSQLNSTAITSIVLCGGADEFNTNRQAVLEYYRLCRKRKPKKSQITLFDPYGDIQIPDTEPMSKQDIIAAEYELLGEPISYDIFHIDWFKNNPINKPHIRFCVKSKKKIKIGGMIVGLKKTERKRDKRPMALISLHTEVGNITVVVVPDVYIQFQQKIVDGGLIVVVGSGKIDENGLTIFAENITNMPSK